MPDEVLVPADVLGPEDVLVPDVVFAPEEAACAPGAFAWTSTDAGEHPNSAADKTNTVVKTLDDLMGLLLAERPHLSPNDDSSVATGM